MFHCPFTAQIGDLFFFTYLLDGYLDDVPLVVDVGCFVFWF